MRSKSSLNKDLELVEVSQDYSHQPETLKPYQVNKEYPPQKIYSLVKEHKLSATESKPKKSEYSKEMFQHWIKESLLSYIQISDKRRRRELEKVRTMQIVKQQTLQYANLRVMDRSRRELEDEKIPNIVLRKSKEHQKLHRYKHLKSFNQEIADSNLSNTKILSQCK